MSEQQSPWSEHAYLDSYGAEAAPQHAFRPGLESLADGDYEFLVLGAGFSKAENSDNILTLVLKTAQEGRDVDHTYWLNKQRNVNALLADLAALQFPARTWGSRPGQTPLSVAIPDAVSRLRGSRFKARKTSRKGKPAPDGVAATYHDLVILGPVKTTPQAPVLTRVPLSTPPPAPQQAPVREPLAREAAQQQVPVYSDEDVPF